VFKFITRQHFLVNFAVAILLFLGLIFLFLSFLNVITRHNDYEKVPEITNMNLRDALDALEKNGFKWEVQDSVWEPDVAPLTVLMQSPIPGQMVKAHRIIFLTVNKSQPPVIQMPDFVGFSFRNAELYMNQLGLKLGDTIRKPDIARDAVLEQLYNGRQISPGTSIFKGSTISLVLGSGLGENENNVPDLFGLTYAEAISVMQGLGMNLGALLPDVNVRDTANAYVYRQNPNPITKLPDGKKQVNRMREGQSIDLWISSTPKERVEVFFEEKEEE
jgi:eukaryotic-like serine/threonine-protein kinase